MGSLDSDGPSAEAAAAAAANGEMTLMAKRSRFPGTPSIALAKGRGVLAVSEVLVTWVSSHVFTTTAAITHRHPTLPYEVAQLARYYCLNASG